MKKITIKTNDTFDFSICPYIKERLSFTTYFNFCDNCKIIKVYYNNLSKDAKQFYKWYVYANIYMRMLFKDAIWNYLNSDDEEDFQMLIDLKKQYKAR